MKNLGFFVSHRFIGCLKVATKLAKTRWLQRCGMVGALPGAVFGEVALIPLCAEGVSSNVNGDAQMVAGKADGLDAMCVLLLQKPDVQEAHILERHRVTGGAVVEDHALFRSALAFLPKANYLLDLIFLGHA